MYKQITGTDLSPIQPELVPDNVQFIIDDANEEDWLVGHNYYDYIHTRLMIGAFTDFRDIINRSYNYTKPGGWMECQVSHFASWRF
jgi:metalloendopeptidase OMA1, mitochondrial